MIVSENTLLRLSNINEHRMHVAVTSRQKLLGHYRAKLSELLALKKQSDEQVTWLEGCYARGDFFTVERAHFFDGLKELLVKIAVVEQVLLEIKAKKDECDKRVARFFKSKVLLERAARNQQQKLRLISQRREEQTYAELLATITFYQSDKVACE